MYVSVAGQGLNKTIELVDVNQSRCSSETEQQEP